ncbi:MAG TPA: hypothetical protein VIB79_24365 [Candidatus Binatia bacterium]
MTIFRNIVGMVRGLGKTPSHTTIKCQRCLSGEPALYRVSSDVIQVNVCRTCAEEARSLELKVEPLRIRQRAA